MLSSRQVVESYESAFPAIAGYSFERTGFGKSGSTVYRLSCPGKPVLFLKEADASNAGELKAEHERLTWLEGRFPAPAILGFKSAGPRALLLTRALPGSNAQETARKHWSAVVDGLAAALHRLHSLPLAGCPFYRTLATMIENARERLLAGLVDETDFDGENQGLSARELFSRLEQDQPAFEDLVITHGDASLANAVFDNGYFSGLVDWGRCGIADRYQDLAIASRSIRSHYGPEYVPRFFEVYGLPEADEVKLSYYRLADEFF